MSWNVVLSRINVEILFFFSSVDWIKSVCSIPLGISHLWNFALYICGAHSSFSELEKHKRSGEAFGTSQILLFCDTYKYMKKCCRSLSRWRCKGHAKTHSSIHSFEWKIEVHHKGYMCRSSNGRGSKWKTGTLPLLLYTLYKKEHYHPHRRGLL